jgi:glucose-1-phosphate thymidylyltransferase
MYPSTLVCSKQILSVYDKPLIYYSLSTLMLAGITQILIISTPRDLKIFEELFGDGSQIGISLSYVVQNFPRGIAEAFIIGDEFIDKQSVCLVLGDNIFYGHGFPKILMNAAKQKSGATIFGCHVSNPFDFGVVEFDSLGNAIGIEEKPKQPKSNYAVSGLYFYDNGVVDIAKSIKPSKRGELEITCVNNIYLSQKKMKVELLGRGLTWFDTGNHRAMLEAANFVEAVQTRQDLYIGCIEEVAFRKGLITRDVLLGHAQKMKSTEYGRYLYKIADTKL